MSGKNKYSSIEPVNMLLNRLMNPDIAANIVRYVMSFIGVLLIGSVLIVIQGENPVRAAALIVEGAFGSVTSFGNTLRWATPCLFTGAAAIVAFKSGVTNLGIEGQMYLGAVTAGYLGYAFTLPPGIHAVVCLVGAGTAGAIWVLIPAFMRLFFKINEYVTTMMMNFIACLLADFFVVWYVIPSMGITSPTIKTPNILNGAKLPNLVPGTSASWGYILGILVAFTVYFLYKYTIKGYELKQVGENLMFAKVGGVNVKKTFLSIFIISGFIAGLCGGVEVTGGYNKYVSNFSTTMGWEGIMIADISGHKPIALILVSLVWGALKTGAMYMERATSLNRLTVNLLQMIFVLLVAVDYESIIEYFKNKKQKKISLLKAKREVQA